MSQQIIITLRVEPDYANEAGFQAVKDWFMNLQIPVGEITDIHVDVEDGAPKE